MDSLPQRSSDKIPRPNRAQFVTLGKDFADRLHRVHRAKKRDYTENRKTVRQERFDVKSYGSFLRVFSVLSVSSALKVWRFTLEGACGAC